MWMAARARFLRVRQPRPAILSGRMTLFSTVSLLFMKNCWKTKPNSRFRRRLSCLFLSLVLFCSLMEIEPEVGLSRRARRCMRVDLPEPDLPIMATDSPSFISRLILLSAVKAVDFLP